VSFAPPDSAPGIIELKVERVGALFDAFDPFPIPSRDLSQAAEEFIVGWARDLPRDAPLSIRIHAPHTDVALNGDQIRAAFRNHFASRANRMSGDLRELFRFARMSLLIGIAVLSLCVIVARSLSALIADPNLSRILTEGVVILGWVANWRPIELLLYDWWPIDRRRRLYRRLAAASIDLAPM
jgi:hypothetical protein